MVWSPTPGESWQWQLTGTIDTSFDVAAYDIDLFETPQTTIDALHADGRIVVCYFSGGSYEPQRDDAAAFPSTAIGQALDGWPDEAWLDIRDATVRDIMRARLDRAVSKSCDAVEPDNMDGYANANGLGLSAADQLDYNRWMADEAHLRNLSVGLKNDIDQLNALAPWFDWALNEECYPYDECAAYAGNFLQQGKAVFHAEYATADKLGEVCAVTQPLQISTILKKLDLDAWQATCP
jgi:hypothetical protein